MSSITSANSVFTLSVPGLFPVPQQIQGFTADRAWETNNVALTESTISLEGIKSTGFIFSLTEQTITLQADSPSRTFFTSLINAMRAAREILTLSGTITLPATGESFVCVRGTLKDAKTTPNVGKLLEPVTYVIEWQAIQPTLA